MPLHILKINFCNYCSDYFGEKIFCFGFFLQMLYSFKAKKLGAFLAHAWTKILFDVISGFHSPMKQAATVRDCKINSFLFLLLTHSGRWLLKRGILCKALPFSVSLLMLHPKTIHESGILSKKESCLNLSKFGGWVAL